MLSHEKIHFISGFYTWVVIGLLVNILLDFEVAFNHYIKDNEPIYTVTLYWLEI